MIDTFVTTKEASELTGIPQGTIYGWIRRGELGDTKKQNVTRGRGNGYRIMVSDLNRKVHGWEIDEPKPTPEECKETTAIPKRIIMDADMESLKIAVNNLRVALEIMGDEIRKIEELL